MKPDEKYHAILKQAEKFYGSGMILGNQIKQFLFQNIAVKRQQLQNQPYQSTHVKRR